jgi:hypothetical protein
MGIHQASFRPVAKEPDLTSVSGIAKEAEAVYRHLQRGLITSREASASLALLERMTTIAHAATLERRVKTLEKILAERQNDQNT